MKSLLCTTACAIAVAAPALAQQLIALDSNRSLYTLDPSTGAKTLFGTVSSNAGTTGGLAYDAATATMYLTSTSNDSLYLLDLATGTATLIGAYGDSAVVMHGLEIDSSSGTLYGLSSHNNGLYDIDKSSGVATLIGTSGLSSFSNLGYDSLADVMYSTNSGADSFYQIDRATGATTLIGPLNGPTNPNGLAFNADLDVLYMVDNSTDNFYTIDRVTGSATLIGSTGSGNLLGLAYISSGAPPVVTYCTAGTSAGGCVPAISADNNPSVSQVTSCVISVANVEGQRFGLIFYGVDNTGFVPAPWGAASTSFMCVKAPVQRTPVQDSGGASGACDGTMTLDWNAYQLANPGALGQPFAVGAKAYAQGWYRDPPAPRSTNLSDAVELTYVP